ncbi:TPA: hypothetical protein ACKP07_005035 [Serratia marcescens]|uniref:hypothetical protein n=1 Tax=Serratia marcescens TaxID=615 RepID=UPI00339BA53C
MLTKIIVISGFIIGLLGVALISFGAWSIYPPAGYIVGGLFALLFSWQTAKMASVNQPIAPASEGD